MKNTLHTIVLLSAFAILALTVGCQTVSSSKIQYIGVPTYGPTNPTNVQVLRAEPTRPHVRLGEVRAEPSDPSVNAAKIEDALRKEAAKLGADAVVVVYDRTQVTGAYVTGPWWGRSVQATEGRVIIGVAIKFK